MTMSHFALNRYLGFKERYQKMQANTAKTNKKKTKPTNDDTELHDIRIHVARDGQNVHVCIMSQCASLPCSQHSCRATCVPRL